MSDSIYKVIKKSLKFLSEPFVKLIYINIGNAFNIKSLKEFSTESLQKTLDINDNLLSCKVVYIYKGAGKKTNKITFTLKFNDNRLKSFSWST